MNKYNCQPDGCSGGISWFYKNIIKKECTYDIHANAHDEAYIKGTNIIDKIKADISFAKSLRNDGHYIKSILFFIILQFTGLFCFHWRGEPCAISSFKYHSKLFWNKLFHRGV